MYSVQYRSGDQWVVVNTHGQPMYSGTMLQCEDWLDCQENLPATGPAYQRQVPADFAKMLAPAVAGR